MSETLKVGQRVKVVSKDVRGVIKYYGQTHFSSGKWLGLLLDEPKGKNNGTVNGNVYFQVLTLNYDHSKQTLTSYIFSYNYSI